MTEQHIGEEQLSAFLDGDLESRTADEVDRHLAGCADCRRVLEELRALRDASTHLEELEPSPETWLEIRRRVGLTDRSGNRRVVEPRRRSGRRWLWAGVPVAAAAAAAVLVAILITRPEPAPTKLKPVVITERSSGEMSDELVREYGEYVKGIDAAIEECRVAMAENPGNARVRMAYLDARSSRMMAVDRLASGGN